MYQGQTPQSFKARKLQQVYDKYFIKPRMYGKFFQHMYDHRLFAYFHKLFWFFHISHPCAYAARKNHAVYIFSFQHIRMTTDQLLPVADLLITDYSSVIFEYSIYRKPILLYAPR